MSYEGFQCFLLGIGQIRERVLDLLEICNIREYLFRIDEILVHIIKISENDISPEDEIIQRLCPWIQCSIAFIQFQKQGYAVCCLQSGRLGKEVVYRHHLRSHERNSRAVSGDCIRKIFSEEHHGTTVG